VLACVEKRGELRWLVCCNLGGERWDVEEEGGEEGETEEERKRGRESVGKSVVDFAGGSDTSLLGCPGLNPSVYSVGKFV
jgi:hypothetical protein